MVSRRRSGFTLIELLVVIAIIGILAAMLFPVFARARESARKTQCLANIKNIAIAAQMYLVDYDRFWPSGKSDPQVVQLIDDWCDGCGLDCRAKEWNPYLRVPVILDDYTKNRDIWRCPSAKVDSNSLMGNPINPCTPDWYTALKREMDEGLCRVQGCNTFPPGWGGTITDSGLQGHCTGDADAGSVGAFRQGISNPCIIRDKTPESSQDVSRLVVAGDNGGNVESNYSSDYSHPDYRIPRWPLNTDGCGGHTGSGHCGESDCGNYAVADQCTPLAVCFGGDGKIASDPTYRKTFARHMGGSNLGFADGHAKWMPADQVLLGGSDHSRNGIHPQVYYGLCVCTNLTATPRSDLPKANDQTQADF